MSVSHTLNIPAGKKQEYIQKPLGSDQPFPYPSVVSNSGTWKDQSWRAYKHAHFPSHSQHPQLMYLGCQKLYPNLLPLAFVSITAVQEFARFVQSGNVIGKETGL